MFREYCQVLENKEVAPHHYVLRLGSRRIAKEARPGQFVQITCGDSQEPLLPRPFSFLSSTKNDFSVLYQIVGKGTMLLAQAKRGDLLWVLGPLGNGFRIPQAAGPAGPLQTLLVGGGVGIPPLYHLALESIRQKISAKSIHVFLGARNKSLLLCESDFKKLRVNLHIATDDGSKGKKGFVTTFLEDFLRDKDPKGIKIYTCGPTPMLKAVSAMACKFEVDCEVSVEEPMACGFGVCLGCAIKVKGPRFAMACTEGPVFKADEIVWD